MNLKPLAALAVLTLMACHAPTTPGDLNPGGGGGGGGGGHDKPWTDGRIFTDGSFQGPMYGQFWVWGDGGKQFGFSVDAAETWEGHGSLLLDFHNVANPTAAWGGGHYWANTDQKADPAYYTSFAGKGFDAYTFELKGDLTGGTDRKLTLGFGNGDDPTFFVKDFAIPTVWTKIIVPLPPEADNVRVATPLYVVNEEGANKGSRYWLNDLKFEHVGWDEAGVVLTKVTLGQVNLSAPLAIDGTAQLTDAAGTAGQATFTYTIGGEPWTVYGRPARMVTWTSSNPAVATVAIGGLVTGHQAGTADLVPTVHGVAATTAGGAAQKVTVTVFGASTPTALAPVPGTLTASAPTFWSSTGGGTAIAYDRLQEGADWEWPTAPTTAEALGGGQVIKVDFANSQYTTTYLGGTTGVNLTGKTKMHLDYWTLSPGGLNVKLLNDRNGTKAEGEKKLAATTAGAWTSLDLNLGTDFPGLTARGHIDGLIFGQEAKGAVFYLDHIYFY